MAVNGDPLTDQQLIDTVRLGGEGVGVGVDQNVLYACTIVLNNKKKSVDNLQLYTEHLCEIVSMMVKMGLKKELIALVILVGWGSQLTDLLPPGFESRDGIFHSLLIIFY